MAYSRITRFVAALCTAVFSVLTVVSTTFVAAYEFAQALRWPDYAPDVRESLHLDRVRHELNAGEPQGLRRSISFRMRALLHDLFTGSGFAEPQAVASA
jgi:hypothetical protein